MKKRNIVIIGAAGRDFHNFNTVYRDDPNYNVVAFTAAQIPDIDKRIYPAELAGSCYPDGIPIVPEQDLGEIIKEYNVHRCVFSYSDVSYGYVMKMSAFVNATGAGFVLLGHKDTMLKSTKPVISVSAIRTGCGKSQTSRKIMNLLNERGLKTIAVRHPMPYGDLYAQKVQRFAQIADLEKHMCTIEEMEEYEQYVAGGNVIYAGVDYEAILRAAENDPNGCDIILWDGGNNDFPFYLPDLAITIVDPHRPNHEISYYPGEVALRMADVVIINKMDSAAAENIQIVRNNIANVNPSAKVINANSAITVDNPDLIKGKRVLVIEDGPTLTHGEMKLGAGVVAAQRYGAKEMIDPKPFAVGKLKETFKTFPNVGSLLPAMGYSKQQIRDLEATISAADCDSVVVATPIDLSRVCRIDKPQTRVHYDLQEIGKPDLNEVLDEFIKKHK